MQLDIRLPIGLLFSILGAIIGGYGLWTMGSAEMYQRSLGTNLNLWTGLGCLAFGLFMLLPALKKKGCCEGAQAGKPEEANRK